jgi:hypothetical protein
MVHTCAAVLGGFRASLQDDPLENKKAQPVFSGRLPRPVEKDS